MIRGGGHWAMASEDAVLTSSTAQLVSIDAGGHHIVQVSNVQVDELDEEDDASQEPPPKRIKVDPEADLNMDSTLKQLMYQVNRAICMRLDKIQNNLDSLNSRVLEVENKLEQVLQQSRQQGHVFSPGSNRRGAVIVGLPQNGKSEDGLSSDGVQNLGPNVTLITLNTEEDFPQGTWLGDENNPEMRVRVPITPSDLLHIHSNCRTPEKMALTLLDYLFDRETQATSNLSGMGKHGKNQLDPLMIYGIRCHLIHRFAITESDWHRIKQNIDSKCRTAYRRKQRGMPLTVKAFRGKAPSTYVMGGSGHLLPGHDLSGASDEDSLSRDDEELHIHQGDGDIHAMQGDGISPGEIQILHATPEQISQLQQAHHIQILQGDQVIGQIPSDVANLAGLDGHHQVHMVTTDSGEVLTIQQAPSDSSD